MTLLVIKFVEPPYYIATASLLRSGSYSNTIHLFSHSQASKRYLAVARSMKQYEDELYSEWKDGVENTLPVLLKRTVLAKPPPIPTPLPRSTAQTPISWDSRATSRADYSHLLPPGEELAAWHRCGAMKSEVNLVYFKVPNRSPPTFFFFFLPAKMIAKHSFSCSVAQLQICSELCP